MRKNNGPREMGFTCWVTLVFSAFPKIQICHVTGLGVIKTTYQVHLTALNVNCFSTLAILLSDINFGSL